MELQSYCDGVANELAGWRDKISDIMAKFDKVSCGEKSTTYQHVNELHMVVEEMGERIEKLRTECPTYWEPYKEEFEEKYSHMKRRWEESWEESSPSQIGG